MNSKLSWSICGFVVLAVLVTACATPSPTPAPTAAPTATPVPTATLVPTAATPTKILFRFLAKGTVKHPFPEFGPQGHTVRFSIEDFAKVLDYSRDGFYWREIQPRDLHQMALVRCWVRCETVTGPQFPTCFLDLSLVPAGPRFRPIEEGDPAFWVKIVTLNPEYNVLDLAWSNQLGPRPPTGGLPAIGEDVYLIGSYKGLEWDIVPY